MKGFSLFTPLVGTTVIMIAIVVSAAMVQNDIRISRGLTASYEVSSQSISSKIIRAAIDVTVIENIDIVTNSFLRGNYAKPAVVVTCSNINSCLTFLKDKFTSPSSVLIRELSGGGQGIYSGTISSIESVTNYKSVNDVEPQISTFLLSAPSAIKGEFDTDGYLNIKIDTAVLSQRNDLFSVAFVNRADRYDHITLNIIPYGFTYHSKDKIGEILSKSAKAFETALNGQCLSVLQVDNRVNEMRKYVDGRDVRLELDWATSAGIFTVAMQNKDKVYPDFTLVC